MAHPTGIHPTPLAALLARERDRYTAARPLSQALAQRTNAHLLYGVPLHWMTDWGTPFPLFVEQARGARFRDADGHEYVDFCLGDTGAMFGHAPKDVAAAVNRQSQLGFTTMLPGEDAARVGELLAERFGLPFWQFAMTATDANRFVIRWARAVTGRTKVLVFNGCYHGTADDVFVDLVDGVPTQRDSLLGQAYNLNDHTVVVEFNDLAALEAALAQGNVACMLAEPVMTNIGMVLPQPGFWATACSLIREAGSLLVCDETHTISTGPAGYAKAYGLEPDFFVLGKPIGGGIPCAVYGFSAELAQRMQAAKSAAPPGHSGIGTTLTANALAMAAIRATLEGVMTDAAYAHMINLATQLAAGLRGLIKQYGLEWCVSQVGARTEFQFCAQPPQNGTEASLAMDHELEHALHLYLLNRGVLITPFHNMLLVCPDTTTQDVEKLLTILGQALAELTGPSYV
ncbi:aspartate aminotransferase family protein [Chitinimonas sp. BJB300]|uniref:aspartate aminotransferase family protein n=1 Tax=Chitinimonas sp. BJB300 TaxID=1559339 RepID=UPI000C0D9437|nr:aspartate aminotransferase family protein [Chitinimonas sp. BJB300]PHV11860.1 aspartate aminotransferase family protein [Chitinimonas sp. BJB300]TSJ87777.1 aspartate aminotransferase family protein [Chitinimonas sp. BJB300]